MKEPSLCPHSKKRIGLQPDWSYHGDINDLIGKRVEVKLHDSSKPWEPEKHEGTVLHRVNVMRRSGNPFSEPTLNIELDVPHRGRPQVTMQYHRITFL